MAINPLDPNSNNIDDIRQELTEIQAAFSNARDSIIDTIRDINRATGQRLDTSLNNIVKYTKQIDDSYGSIIANLDKGIKGDIRRKAISSSINKLEESRKKINAEIGRLQLQAQTVDDDKRKALLEAIALLSEQEDKIEDIIRLNQRERDEFDRFNRNKLQPLEGFLKGLGKIPIIGNIINTERGVEKMQDAAKGGAGFMKTFGAGLKGAFEGFGKILSRFFIFGAILTAIIKLVKLWWGGMLDADKMNTNIARNLGVQKDLAQQIRSIYRDNKVGVEDIFFTTQNQVEAAEQLNNAYGTGYILSKEILQSQIDLNKVLGLSVEESAALNKIFIGQNMTADQFRKSIISQTLEVNKQKGIQLNYKKVYQDIAKLSSEIIVNYKNQIPLIANAVTKMNALGLSMDDASQISSNILDWQSSIESELEAELLMGRQLNAERARVLALNNDIAGAAKAMMEDTGLTLYNFQSMNAVVKGSLAKYLGISVDKLSDALLIQENMKKLSSSELEVLRKRLGSEEKLNEFLKTRNDINTIDKGLMELTIQEKFNQALQKAKEIFSDFVSGGMLDKLVNVLNKLINDLSRLTGVAGEQAKSSTALPILKNIEENKDISSSQKELAKELQESMSKTDYTFIGRLIRGGTANRKILYNNAIKAVLARMSEGEEIKDAQKEIYKEFVQQKTGIHDEIMAKLAEKTFNEHEKYLRNFVKEGGNRDGLFGLGRHRMKSYAPTVEDYELAKKQNDFIVKGNKIIPFHKDDLIMGGTNLMNDKKIGNGFSEFFNKVQEKLDNINIPIVNKKIVTTENIKNITNEKIKTTEYLPGSNEVVMLLREIATAIREGGNVMLDGQKVGMALAKGTYRTA